MRAREPRELGAETAADAASLPLVDDLEGDLGLGRVRVADVAADPDRAAGLLVDRDDGLAARATDVDEQIEVALVQARLGAEKAQVPGLRGEAGEDLEHRPAVAGAEGPESDCGHATSVAAPLAASTIRPSGDRRCG